MDFLHLPNQLSRILFEPFFLLMIAGISLAFFLNIHRRNRMFYSVLFGVGFMIAWRACVHLLSKRYSEILIYAGIGFTAYFLYVFPSWLICRYRHFLQRRYPKIEQTMRCYPRLISRVLILILVLVCFGKLCRYNRYDGTIPKSCEVVKRDAAKFKKPLIIELCEEQARFHYYSDLPIFSINNDSTREEQWKHLSLFLKRDYDVIYVFCKEQPGEKFSLFSEEAYAEKWEQIFSAPRNNRKKTYINVYRHRKLSEK